MNHLQKHKEVLEILRTAKPKLRSAILKFCDDNIILSINEIVVNLLKGNIPLSKNQKQKLKKYKRSLRKLNTICEKKPINKKRSRKVIIQTGGFLPAILGIIGPIIAKAALGGVAATAAGYATKKIIGD